MKNSIKIALCGVLAALSTVVMFLTGLIPIATIALPAIAGCLLILVVAELGVKWGFTEYAVCSLVALLLTPDREAALFYILFFGYYPVLVGVLGGIKNKALQTATKYAIFNLAVIIETLLSVYVLGIPWETIGILGKFTPVVLLALANVMFYLYDRALRGLIAVYFVRFHDKLRRLLNMK